MIHLNSRLKRLLTTGWMMVVSLLSLLAASASHAQTTNYTDIWWNKDESGWGIQVTHHNDQIFGTWYTYDVDGSQLFVTLPGCSISPGGKFNGSVCEGELYRTKGTPITATTFTGATATKIGTAKLTFTGANAATFNYKIGAVDITKAIERFSFGTGVSNYPNDASDLYYQDGAAGWGFSLAQHGNTHFGVIYHYDESGNPLFAVMSNGQQSGNTVSGDLFITQSARSNYSTPTWNSADISVVSAAPIGKATLTLSGSGFAMTFTYKGNSQTRQMSRLAFGTPVTPPATGNGPKFEVLNSTSFGGDLLGQLNQQGARGFRAVSDYGFGTNVQALYVKDINETYAYEILPTPTSRNALLQQANAQGARGFRLFTFAVAGAVYIKNNSAPGVFIYEILPEGNVDELKINLSAQGAKGFWYVGPYTFEITGASIWSVFAKNTSSNAAYAYELQPVATDLTNQLNGQGDRGFRLKAALLSGYLFVKDTTQSAKFIYTSQTSPATSDVFLAQTAALGEGANLLGPFLTGSSFITVYFRTQNCTGFMCGSLNGFVQN